MIETLPQEGPLSELALPEAVHAQFVSFRSSLLGRSQIIWGEHCSECAYPTCYAHCVFYTPRSDFHCRRFVAGIETLKDDRALTLIRFRKWGKLEGQGPSAILPMDAANRRDRIDAAASKLVAVAPVPFSLKRRACLQWNRRKAQARPDLTTVAPDAFAVEFWTPAGGRHPFTVTFLSATAGAGPEGRLFQARFEISSGYGRLVVPVADIAAQVDLNQPFLCQIEPIGEAEGIAAVFGVCDFVVSTFKSVNAHGLVQTVSTTPKAKVVVWDLDETIWTGVLVEDGADGVRLRATAVAAIRHLDERGILQTIASKNNSNEAIDALNRFGLLEYFLHPQIHWGLKSASIAAQAKAFDLSLDSFVFIDDQGFERAEVKSVHPQVRTLTHDQVSEIPTHPWFDGPSTAESRHRRSLYLRESLRSDAFQAAGEDYRNFLKASGIELSIDPLGVEDVERVVELSQRTNQLNFTGRKYTREAVRDLLVDASRVKGLVLRCRDRFGDYGVVGFVVINSKSGGVSELFLSCRVQRKRVEQALFAWLGNHISALGGARLEVIYHPTGRNGAARDMLAALEFRPRDESSTIWEKRSEASIEDADIVAVIFNVLEPVV